MGSQQKHKDFSIKSTA